jgi:uncharacterized protein YbbC (DUF1343 family)
MRLSFFISLIFLALALRSQSIIPGAENIGEYMPKLKGKKIALVCNPSSKIGDAHIVDFLLKKGITITKIFAPEHGFRGDADAGAHIKSGIDTKTNLPILSLYGDSKKPKKEDFDDIQCVIFDIQDVGCRFYTYISTLEYLMEACADYQVSLMVLDRPNPNASNVDGPVLDMKYRSFVGMQAIPIVYGMTIGEYAKMLVGEKWLKSKNKLNLTIIPCKNYDHKTFVHLTIPPSPNLKSDISIALYPSLCLFEGTEISVGRGTETPFEVYGSPYLDRTKMSFNFTPISKKGATNPPCLNQICFGQNLRPIGETANVEAEEVVFFSENKFELKHLLNAYQNWTKEKSEFFLKNLFFDKLAGNSTLRQQIIDGKTEAEIRKSWEPALTKFKKIRSKYLLYKD